jgi:hypothetical protein
MLKKREGRGGKKGKEREVPRTGTIRTGTFYVCGIRVSAKTIPAPLKERGPSNTSKAKRKEGEKKEKRDINKNTNVFSTDIHSYRLSVIEF